MSKRINPEMLENVFSHLCAAIGAPMSDPHKTMQEDAKIKAWFLDFNGTGWAICRLIGTGTEKKVQQEWDFPMGSERCSARELMGKMQFALLAFEKAREIGGITLKEYLNTPIGEPYG